MAWLRLGITCGAVKQDWLPTIAMIYTWDLLLHAKSDYDTATPGTTLHAST